MCIYVKKRRKWGIDDDFKVLSLSNQVKCTVGNASLEVKTEVQDIYEFGTHQYLQY